MTIDSEVNGFAAKLNKTVSPDDVMYQHNYDMAHYLYCGDKSFTRDYRACQVKPPETVLDFGAGARRVSRV
jgi:hypothetical protein